MPRQISLAMPDLRRTDATSVFVAQVYVPGRASGLETAAHLAEQWSRPGRPSSVLSFSCYLSTGEDTVLTYVQCDDGDSYHPFVRSLEGAAQWPAVEYRLRRSVRPAGNDGPPACVVVATFDVDGAERQDRVIDSLSDAIEGMPADRTEGMISANFHVSTDASRVLNYAEWTSDEAHTAFLGSTTREATKRASGGIPGVRPIGFKRYHLLHGIR
ncbi:antibiotic biosynthesis monooxygenase [Streptomyces sp. QL37]|uniref:antibiotic biosynthesis monooxygenase n=1 Tax=Streptomyces sp. QL37 TaxID=2093747 RepID=UPI000CF1D3BF|nr:antibiotic biosynthesis monooxygenase [Streptomyces sp. QL37]PPQ57498.1 hypothetical protein C5F59_12955 [Streptomyces sp. QL37]